MYVTEFREAQLLQHVEWGDHRLQGSTAGNNIALNSEKCCSMVIGDNETSQEMILEKSLALVRYYLIR